MQGMRPRFELKVPFGPDEVHEQMELLRCFLQEILTLPHERSTSELCPPAPDEERKLPLATDT